nr:ribonuclease H-like domain-containing protein [Tanacetum cinerariifolium]
MSTQQDIYAASSENCPPMLNKDNYVPWSSRIIRYARSRPNGKMIIDSIKNGPYEKKAKLFNEWEKFTSTDGESIESYYHRFMQLMNNLKRNKHFPENIASNLKNGGIQVAQNDVQNAGVQNGRNQNGLVVVPGIVSQNGTGNVVAVRAEEEFDFMAAAGDLDEIKEVNANYILMANLQHASTSEETLELAQESHEKNEILKKEIKPANYAKINHMLAKFVRDFRSLAKEADESLDKQKSLEHEIERLLKTNVGHDSMSIVQNGFVDVSFDLQTELDHTKEKHKFCIIKKEKEYAVLWNNWYIKCEECKYDKISYDKAYNDMQQKVKRLQALLRDLKGKSSGTLSALNTLDPLNKKLESKIVELEFQVVNYEREISHLKTTYKYLFDSITSNRAHVKLHELIYENVQLRAGVFENTSKSMKNTPGTSVTPHVDKPMLSVVTPHSKKLYASIMSHSVPQPREFNVMKHKNVLAPGMFKINLSQTPRVDLVPNKQSRLVHTARTRRPQPKGNTRNARVPSASKSSEVKKTITVKYHRRTLLLSKNQKTMSSECNNIKLAIRNDK